MKYYSPQISWHNRKEIFCLDVQATPMSSDSRSTVYRVATGGSDCRINVWHIRILEVPELDKKKPVEEIDCVAELTRQQRPCNAIQFSPSTVPSSPSTSSASSSPVAKLPPSPTVSPSQVSQYLASGDDDGKIYIWKYYEDEETTQPQVAEFDEEIISKETWRVYKILHGHNKDLCDLAWSPCGQQLVSGGMDNKIFVWDVEKGTKIKAFLNLKREHTSYVQGVAYDPLSRYIVSFSNDRSMMIYDKSGKLIHNVDRIVEKKNPALESSKNPSESKSSQEKNEDSNNNNNDDNSNDTNKSKKTDEDGNGDGADCKNINKQKFFKIFHDQNLMSFVRRLTFTPGGEFLIAPAGLVDKGPNEEAGNAIYVFSRKSLDRPSFYLPTANFSLAVRCCPVLFELRDNPSNIFNLPYRIVFAAATEDAIYFYDSQQAMPFGYIAQIHTQRMTDMSWSSDGRFLMVSSIDGYTSFVVFDHNELGTLYTGPRLTLAELEPLPLPSAQKKPRKSTKNRQSVTAAAAAAEPGKENEAVSPEKKKKKTEKVKVPAAEKPESAKHSASKKVEKTPPKSHPSIKNFFTQRDTPTASSPGVSATPPAVISSPHNATLPHKQASGTSLLAARPADKKPRRVSLMPVFSANSSQGSAPPPAPALKVVPPAPAPKVVPPVVPRASTDSGANSDSDDDCMFIEAVPAEKKAKVGDA